MGEHPHPHRGGHCDCDDHDGHRRSCEDPDCPGCLAEDAHDPECELCEGTGAYWWEWGPEDAGDCDLCRCRPIGPCTGGSATSAHGRAIASHTRLASTRRCQRWSWLGRCAFASTRCRRCWARAARRGSDQGRCRRRTSRESWRHGHRPPQSETSMAHAGERRPSARSRRGRCCDDRRPLRRADLARRRSRATGLDGRREPRKTHARPVSDLAERPVMRARSIFDIFVLPLFGRRV